MNDSITLSNSDLLTQIRIEAANEREAGLNVIRYLREVSRRRLHIEQGYSSLHAFCTEYLKYSNGSTWRRIQAMRALEDLPELETQIAKGETNLANVSAVQNFCNQQNKTCEEKRDLLVQVANLSKREVEQKLAELAPQAAKPETARPINPEQTELRITLDKTTVQMLDQIRGWISHSIPNASYGQVVGYLIKKGMKSLDPAAAKRPRKSDTNLATQKSALPQIWPEQTQPEQTQPEQTQLEQIRPEQTQPEQTQPEQTQPEQTQPEQTQPEQTQPEQTQPEQTQLEQIQPEQIRPERTQASLALNPSVPCPPPRRGKIPAAIRRAVYQRDRGRCIYTHPETGKNCGSSIRIQIDHRIPVAKGGQDDLKNLRLMCQAHNLNAAIEEFGDEKMKPFLKVL